MKKLLIISAIVGIVALTSNQSHAQVSLNVNIGAQPAWVPAGYQDVNYYYLPEVQSYYYVPQRQFVYLSGNRWIRSSYLPTRYRGYNLNHGRKVVVYGNSPYRSYNTHRVRYANNVHYSNSSYGRGPVRYNSYRSYKPDNRRYDYGRHDNRNHDRHGNGNGNSSRGRGRH
ncbi:hypothetical protein [Pedobacter punctiformis]|uniref:YXWGXW repeat-containing protein n=1 Tax=Pedobacter punctiformis TaxID=3004097 RepID=A0ABT4L701_9SPHI|nr:hypothetical protein [Pedobacter sp. HCMS5-2]MCZ4243699.1 hypothetical protein [Pedobacter sp. HCMS5-2]